MATLSVGTVDRAGFDIAGAVAAAGGGDKFANSGVEFLYIENLAGSGITLTIQSELTADGLALPDKTVSVGAGVRMLLGPFPTQYYRDADGYCNLTYSAVTSVKVKPLQLTTS